MTLDGINYLAVLIAAIASFVFGGVWYGILAKQWMAAAGMSEEDTKASRKIAGVQWQLPFTFVMLLVIAFTLAGLMGHITGGQVSVRTGLISGLLTWLGFVLTTMSVNHAYQGRPLSLTIIDSLHWLIVLLIHGAIIGFLGT